jgi:hypothetical protein
MSQSSAPLTAIDEVRQANRLFLGFLRSRPVLAAQHFGLSPHAASLLGRVKEQRLELAAGFPRALFRLSLPRDLPDAVHDPVGQTRDPELRALLLTLLLTARNLSRTSGYSARLLLRLSDEEVRRLRHCELGDLLLMSLGPSVLHSAFDDLESIVRQILAEPTPERRRRLVLLGLQPDCRRASLTSRM